MAEKDYATQPRKERWYYKNKKTGKAAYNLKEPLENILEDTSGYVEITKEEWDELTYVAPHIPTTEEKRVEEVERQIANLKSELAKTDYRALKYAEGWYTEEEYAPYKAERQALRDQINALEETL